MSSYRQIFKSSVLIGGTQVINIAIGIIRTKALALLLGPAGIGLAGLYMSATALIGSVVGLGLNVSGVQQIAEAAGTKDENRIVRTIVTLRRLTLVSGLLGMIIALALAPLLSRTTFGDNKHVFAIALMSLTLLFNNLSMGQSVLLQGLRRLRDLATSQILGTAFGAVVSVALVWWLREKGIVPYLVAISAFGVILSWWYARRVPVQRVPVTWRETLVVSRSLLVLGVAFTVSPLISSSSAYLIRILIQHQLGMEAVGIYTATWTLSIYYIGFVVTAMGTDFLPRLSAANNDHAAMNRMVNEQIEMGVLVAVPGVLVTVTLAPWVITMLYSGSFVQGAEMVRWQILGIFLRVVSWPLNCILIAKGKSLWFLLGELVFGVTYVGSVLVCLKLWKLEGLGMAFALTYLTYTTLMLLMAWRLTEFHWSATALKILVPAVLIMGAIFGCTRFLPVWWSVSIGLAATVVAGLASLQVLQKLLGVNLLARIRSKLPWAEETN